MSILIWLAYHLGAALMLPVYVALVIVAGRLVLQYIRNIGE